jgi:2-polyprenyl-3-methyl-5-hydroxy-6-metoxy-1,4-benzoquinol methylase
MRICTRDICGMAWLDPCPVADDIHLAYASYYTHTDGIVSHTKKKNRARRLWRKLIGRRLERLRIAAGNAYECNRFSVARDTNRAGVLLTRAYRLFPFARAETDFSYMYTPVIPGGRLLEVGCGSGWMLELMQARGWRAQGIDFDEKAVNHARSRGLSVQLGGLQAQNYCDHSFEIIVGSHLIEHLYETENFLRECKRILAEDGRVVLVTPNLQSLGHKFFKRHWRGLEPPRHVHLFTAAAIAQIAKRAGFRRCDTYYSLRDANHLFQASYNLYARGWHRHGESVSGWLSFSMRALQCLEYVLMKFKPSLGEELIIILS